MSSEYDERRRQQLDAEWKRLDEQKPYAWILLVVGAGFFVGNFLDTIDSKSVLGGMTLGAMLAGGGWLWHLHREINRIIRSRIVDEQLSRRGPQP